MCRLLSRNRTAHFNQTENNNLQGENDLVMQLLIMNQRVFNFAQLQQSCSSSPAPFSAVVPPSPYTKAMTLTHSSLLLLCFPAPKLLGKDSESFFHCRFLSLVVIVLPPKPNRNSHPSLVVPKASIPEIHFQTSISLTILPLQTLLTLLQGTDLSIAKNAVCEWHNYSLTSVWRREFALHVEGNA